MKIIPEIEILDLVDSQDNIVSQMDRDEVYKQGLSNFRVVNVFVKNTSGKLFIPRRQKHKRLFPLGLDVSAGGHVSSGETYDEAFAKEVREELNIDVKDFTWKILGKMSPEDNGVSAFMTIYEISSDNTPKYNPHDFIEHFWITPEEILERINKGDYAKSDIPKIIREFYIK